MRIIVADCSAHYAGRLNATLPLARRVILIKADNSLLIFSELGSYKPLNWMAAPCVLREIRPKGAARQDQHELPEAEQSVGIQSSDEQNDDGHSADINGADVQSDDEHSADMQNAELIIRVSAQKSDDVLEVTFQHIVSDTTFELGIDPGLTKDGVEEHLQDLLSKQMHRVGEGVSLVRREYPTAIGPVDIMGVNREGQHFAIEIKRNGGIDGVEQLTRYVELLNRDPLIAPIRGVFAAQTISPQARTLAEDRGFQCLILDYEEMKGTEDGILRLF